MSLDIQISTYLGISRYLDICLARDVSPHDCGLPHLSSTWAGSSAAPAPAPPPATGLNIPAHTVVTSTTTHSPAADGVLLNCLSDLYGTEAPWCAPLQLWWRWCGGGCPLPPLSMPPTVPLRPRTLQQQPTLTNTRQHHEIATSPHYTELTPLCP